MSDKIEMGKLVNADNSEALQKIMEKFGKQNQPTDNKSEKEQKTENMRGSVLKQLKADLEKFDKEEIVKANEQPTDQTSGEYVAQENNDPIEKVKQEKPKRCPNCNWDISKNPSDVEDADKYAWLNCVLSGQPFVKEYKLAGGKLSLRYTTRTKKAVDAINSALLKEEKDGSIPSDNSRVYLLAHTNRQKQLNLTASFVGLNDKEYPGLFTEEGQALYGGDNVIDRLNNAHEVKFGDMDEMLYSAVLKHLLIFDDMCFKLVEAVNSPDFY